MTQTIRINVPKGKIAKYNEQTNTIEFIDDTRSKSWEDYCEKHPFNSEKHEYATGILSNKKDAEGIMALIKLIRLREEWIDGWEPDYTDDKPKYIVNIQYYDEIRCSQHNKVHKVLSFPTEEMCEEFIKCFEKLIMTAKKFI